MKIFTNITRTLADALMHYVCIRLKFRSSVLNDSAPVEEAAVCEESCCPTEG